MAPRIRSLAESSNVRQLLEDRYRFVHGGFVMAQDQDGDLHVLTYVDEWGCGFHYIFVWCGDDFYLWSLIGMTHETAIREMEKYTDDE